MKKAIWVLNVDNYRPDICAHTIPTIKNFADKINAEFYTIDKRKFHSFPATAEKLQIYELGKQYDVNVLIDADILISPALHDVTKNTISNPGLVSVMQVFPIPETFPYNYIFDRLPLVKSRNIVTKVGPSANFVVTTKWSHDLWNTDVSIPESQNPFRVDEYVLSYNLARYGYSLDIFGNPYHSEIFHAEVSSNPSDDDLDKILKKKEEWLLN